MDRRETEGLLTAIRQARAVGEPAAVATVVRVTGSAYRREGTRMFVRQNGTYECALSGGCLEPTVAESAARVIATGEPTIVSYDLADDSVWGLGIGCSGAVDIRIERIEDDAITREWLRILEQGEAAARVTPLDGAAGRMIVRHDGERVGDLIGPNIEEHATARACARLAAPHLASGPERVGDAELFFEVDAAPS
jgi:xanthine/CO dehydrogenase XdhC/CoxF family maturation factor